ncbi:MAG: FGGY family carbohydrate kinase [bacterium]|nr:FGGY family carbohydrate kinase [bacterium]
MDGRAASNSAGILVIDVGSTSVRTAVVDPSGRLRHTRRAPTPRRSPGPGLLEFDPVALAEAALGAAAATLQESGEVEAVGIANQRASTVVWDRATGEPVGPGLGWQDLRTALDCLALQGDGLRLTPNQPATKAAHLISTASAAPETLCVGTLDSWLVWQLTGGAEHLTDATNAAISGLTHLDRVEWDHATAERLGIPIAGLPQIRNSSGVLGEATALAGAPPITGLAGDQQAALVGAGCVRRGDVKITFGTGGTLDACLGPGDPPADIRGPSGTFPIVAWQQRGEVTWGIEALMLSAGSCVRWLCELGLIERPSDSEARAAACPDSGEASFVPAQMGLGAPDWDFGARSAFAGMTTVTGAAQLVRAVLEGVALRGADLLEAARADSGLELAAPVIDGGMSANAVFAQALADAAGCAIALAPEIECTALGAGYLAGVGIGLWDGWDEVASLRSPRGTVEPRRPADRARWRETKRQAAGWHPDLSAVSF